MCIFDFVSTLEKNKDIFLSLTTSPPHVLEKHGQHLCLAIRVALFIEKMIDDRNKISMRSDYSRSSERLKARWSCNRDFRYFFAFFPLFPLRVLVWYQSMINCVFDENIVYIYEFLNPIFLEKVRKVKNFGQSYFCAITRNAYAIDHTISFTIITIMFRTIQEAWIDQILERYRFFFFFLNFSTLSYFFKCAKVSRDGSRICSSVVPLFFSV